MPPGGRNLLIRAADREFHTTTAPTVRHTAARALARTPDPFDPALSSL